MATTFCVDSVAALVVILEAQKTATPTLLRKVWDAQPGAFNELPAAFVDAGEETITHDAGTRTRTMSGLSFTVVDNYTTESGPDRLNQLRDALVDRFDLNVEAINAAGNAILELTRIVPRDVTLSGQAPNGEPRLTVYRGLDFIFGNTAIKEGRQ